MLYTLFLLFDNAKLILSFNGEITQKGIVLI